MEKYVVRAVASGLKFDLKAPNGQVVATSETYESKAACLKGLASVRKNGPKAKLEDQTEDPVITAVNPNFELYRDKAGEYRFRLKAKNGQIIAISESYRAKAACLDGIESVRLYAADAEVEGI